MLWLRALRYFCVSERQIEITDCLIDCSNFLGDGNLHLNITSREYDGELLNKIEPFVYDWVSRHRGSVSAEHGLGLKKRDYIGYSKSNVSIEWMRHIKRLFDPNNILNPYKVFPVKSTGNSA